MKQVTNGIILDGDGKEVRENGRDTSEQLANSNIVQTLTICIAFGVRR
jgi:hypothetical protein